MQRELALVTEWLLRASSQIDDEYFQLPVAGCEELEYRERVYCYELYHRWRCHWPSDFPFTLSGEVDKAGHPLIRSKQKPDFLVHIAGRMDNMLIIEVKPANADRARMIEDLNKLTYFRRELRDQYGNPGNYHAAYFWLYGLSIDGWPEMRRQLLASVRETVEFDRSLVTCIIHQAPGTRASVMPWGDLEA